MAEIVWTDGAIEELNAIADYIALEDREAAASLVVRVVRHVDQLEAFPESGSRPAELRRSRYRQIVEPPCRVLYRYDGSHVYILHVMRTEQRLRRTRLVARDPAGAPTKKPGRAR